MPNPRYVRFSQWEAEQQGTLDDAAIGDAPGEAWVRTPGQRDRDRILYTSALRRLATVTQVVAPTEGHVVHNRLTHTLEVAQIGRRLAEKLLWEQADLAQAQGGIDPDVVEAASLAHDLGHPPFGHLAEEELHKLAREEGVEDGFNGNAQSFRIVTRLAVRLLLGSVYESKRIKKLSPHPAKQEIEAAFDDALDWTSARPYDGTHLQRGILSRWKSTLIDRFIGALTIEEPRDRPERRLRISRELELQVNVLKELTWYYVINSTATATQRYGQRTVVHDLFCIFAKAAKSTNSDHWLIFPNGYQEELDDLSQAGEAGQQERVRLAVDLVASMTEQQALAMYQRLTGTSLGSVLDPARL